MKHLVLALGIFICFASPAYAEGEIIIDTVDALKDTYIDAFTPTATHGLEPVLTLWNTDEPQFFILIQFDLGESSFLNMPDSLDFLNGTMGLYCWYSGGAGDADIYNAATNGWDEASVNYNNMPGYDAEPKVTSQLPSQGDLWFNADVTPLLGPDTFLDDHCGFYVHAIPDSISWDFYSRNAGDSLLLSSMPEDLTPKLYLTYEVTTSVAEDKIEATPSLHVSALSSGTVSINYSLPSAQNASLVVYDASGSLLQTLEVSSGKHSVTWPSSPGVYFVRLAYGSEVIVRKVVSIR